jgi:sorting nexin-8
MSLFGDEDVPSRAKQSSSLFDDDPKPAGKTGNSLFADEIDSTDSPWAFPTPKKAGRGSLVKSLLPASDVPESYIDAFDAVLDAGDGAGNGISIDGAKKLMASSGVSRDAQSKVLDIVVQPGQEDAGLGRNEFNVLFALIGLAQEGEDITLDSVDERKRSQCNMLVPIPSGATLITRQVFPSPRYRCPSR